MREVVCSSGALLKVSPAPFADAKNLYQALLKELGIVSISEKMEMGNLFKDLFCIGFSSPEIERCLWKCMERCTYDFGKGNMKITLDSFEPVECRQDYMQVCVEVTKENVLPFAKALLQEYRRGLEMIPKAPTLNV